MKGTTMKTRALALAAVLAGTTLAAAPQAQAAEGWSVDITTTRAISYGDRFKLEGHWTWFRPHFTTRVTVTCPAGETAGLYFSPVSGNQDPTFSNEPPVCTGAPQTFSVRPAGLKGNVPVTVNIYQGRYSWDGSNPLMATDTQVVRITAVMQAR